MTELPLQGADKHWAAAASRNELLEALELAGRLRRHVDLAMTVCRAELSRRRSSGCGHDAADEITAAEAAGVGRRTGRRDERRAEIAEALPAAGDALSDGEISGEHLDAVAAVVPDELLDAVVDNQHELFDRARDQSADQFRKQLVWFVRDQQRARGIDRSAQQRRARRGRCSQVSRTGMIELHAELDPVTGAHVDARIRAEYRRLLAIDQEASGSAAPHSEADAARTVEQRWADAITNSICGGRPPGAIDDRLPVVVVERSVLESGAGSDRGRRCEIAGLDDIPPETARYMACDREVLALSLDPNGKPVALTSFDRRANRAQRRALAAIHGTCVGPDCEVPFADCHIHHTVPWTTRPITSLDQLAPLCSRHHHLAHEGGWRLHQLADHTIRWIDPRGRTWTSSSPANPPDAREPMIRRPSSQQGPPRLPGPPAPARAAPPKVRSG